MCYNSSGVMIEMVFRYRTSYCTFVLRQIPSGEWGIFIEGETCYSACKSIVAAIDDIRAGVTGCDEWDDGGYLEEEVPDDIREWERIG